jgi:deoxyribonuclease IV
MLKVNVGYHLSLGKKPRLSIQEAAAAGARCAQSFASSPAVWKPPDPNPMWAAEVRAALVEFSIEPLVLHAIYLINLASDNPLFLHRSHNSLVATLRAGAEMGAASVVTHIGSHGGRGFDAVAHNVAAQLTAILEHCPPGMRLLLENSAGAGGTLGSTLPELSTLLNLTGRPAQLGIALDTAHLCGAGWNFAAEGEVERLAECITCTIGWDRLALVHANDSKVAPGSRRDRHEVVGSGTIGRAGFQHLLANPQLTSVPWILETPDLSTDLPDGDRLRSLALLRALVIETHQTSASA